MVLFLKAPFKKNTNLCKLSILIKPKVIHSLTNVTPPGESLAELPHRRQTRQGDQGSHALRHAQPRQLWGGRQEEMHRGREAQNQGAALPATE